MQSNLFQVDCVDQAREPVEVRKTKTLRNE